MLSLVLRVRPKTLLLPVRPRAADGLGAGLHLQQRKLRHRAFKPPAHCLSGEKSSWVFHRGSLAPTALPPTDPSCSSGDRMPLTGPDLGMTRQVAPFMRDLRGPHVRRHVPVQKLLKERKYSEMEDVCTRPRKPRDSLFPPSPRSAFGVRTRPSYCRLSLVSRRL